MLGSVVTNSEMAVWLIAGWCLLALGLAIKITSAFLLLPLMFLIARRRPSLADDSCLPRRSFPGCSGISGPYTYRSGGGISGVRPTTAAIWLGVLGTSALFQSGDAQGGGLDAVGARIHAAWRCACNRRALVAREKPAAGDRRFWWVWGGSTIAAMALLAGKLHHEYYWLPLAPVVAVGAARALDRLLGKRSVAGRMLLGWFSSSDGVHADALDLADSCSSGAAWRRPAVRLRGSCRGKPGWPPPRRFFFRPTAVAAAWSGRATRRRGRPESGGDRPEFRSPLDLIEFYRLEVPATSPTWRAAISLSPRKGLHDGRPPTIQGDSGQPRGLDRRPLRFGDAPECQLKASTRYRS